MRSGDRTLPVRAVTGLAAALTFLDRHRPELILCPGELGDGALVDLLDARIAVPVVALLAVGDDAAARLAIRHGAIDVVFVAAADTAIQLGDLTLERVRRCLRDARDARLLSAAAFRDALTQLPNRALFMDRLGQAFKRGQRDGRDSASSSSTSIASRPSTTVWATRPATRCCARWAVG